MVKLYGVSIRAFLQQKIWFLSTGFKNLHAVQKFRHGKQTSMLRPTKNMNPIMLNPQQHCWLWFSKMSTTTLAKGDFDTIEDFKHLRCFHVFQFGKILLAAKKISA